MCGESFRVKKALELFDVMVKGARGEDGCKVSLTGSMIRQARELLTEGMREMWAAFDELEDYENKDEQYWRQTFIARGEMTPSEAADTGDATAASITLSASKASVSKSDCGQGNKNPL